MKRQFVIWTIVALGFALLAQENQHESLVINIEVPVRVFLGSQFIDNLTINDFNVYENGVLQKLEAVYLVKKKSIERKEEMKPFSPDTSRTFYLFFEIIDYAPKIEDALRDFMQNVLAPGDTLVIVTPLKTYEMKPKTLDLKSRQKIVEDLRGILRKDAMQGSSEYRNALRELTKITRALSSALIGDREETRGQDEFAASEYAEMDQDVKLEMVVNLYKSTLEQLENMRRIDQKKLLSFARILKDLAGQKYVFLFYQREFIPQLEPSIMSKTLGMHQDTQHIVQDIETLFFSFKRDISFDVEGVKQAFADCSASIHFMFFTQPPEEIPGIRFEEHSEDIFTPFREMAQATGGTSESSANPAFLFKSAVEASENYYLLYYTPLNYKRDYQFKNIAVKVKNPGFRVNHRAGYFAN